VLRFCIAVVAIGTAAAVNAQTPLSYPDYRAAVGAYRKGDVNGAAALLANRSPDSLKRAARLLVEENNDWRLVAAAAMLHTELVILGRVVSKPDVSLHMRLALDAIDSERLPFRPPGRDRAQELDAFRERWYSLAASVFLASTDPDGANQFVTRGLNSFKESGRLRLLAGEVSELRAHILYADLHDRAIITVMRPSQARQFLVGAASEYQAALAQDPSLAEAQLRLGRTQALLNHVEPARAALQAAASHGEPRVTYLARLFLGALASYQRDYQAARQEYQAALEIMPSCQTPYIALAYVERLTGHDAAVAELFERFASWQSSPLEADPWWAYQNGGLDEDSLAWLREKVME